MIITVFSDRTFQFVCKTPPAAVLLKKAAGLNFGKKPGSGSPSRTRTRSQTHQVQLSEVAKQKMPDLNTTSFESAERILAGTARSMGI